MEKIDFEQFSLKYKEKNILKISKKCAKSCSLTKSKDVKNLCELAYWLYIYDYKEEVENIYHFVDIELPKKVNFNIWTWILAIWGLQAYIYELNGEGTKKDEIILKIEKIHSIPQIDGETEQEALKFHLRVAGRQTYEWICRKNEIERCILEKNKKTELSYRLIALYDMISYGVTGDYPALNENKERLNQEIKAYVGILKFHGCKPPYRQLFHWDEPEGCLATDRIMVEGEKVGYMYREYPDFEGDSGWRFTCGDEDEEYMNNPKNLGIFELNSVANNDEDIIPLLDSPPGTAFYRDDNGKLVQDRFNILARQEIDEILCQYNIDNKKDYKSRSSEEASRMYEDFKIICRKYKISENEIEEILASIFGE